MNLNCLTCQGMKRTDSDVDMRSGLYQGKPNGYMVLPTVDRSWSGNLVPRPPSYDNVRTGTILMAEKNANKGKYRIHNSAPFETGTPRLVRSSGMRRDWSFEDVRRVNAYHLHK
ncbi:uncharacterized protein LOC113780014 [Coffea eugenioides]|uniref:uncharacterized protein LOC113780014 n=1 Tax=Coffea eugenioides TaxID=49369 RepID=UPI000F5D0BB0|nr:uncharacterized protein LOC113703832 [Coffea arabica]XP_027181637.1 uncharacterized protein LOC113780014 [Coffea eugenioides]